MVDRSRDGSGSTAPERGRSDGVPSTVSRGDAEARCSTGVSNPADKPLSEEARLAALEYLMDAVVVLLEAGEVRRGMALLRGWRGAD